MYDAIASEYDSVYYQKKIENIILAEDMALQKMIPYYGGEVLDLGCGTGYFLDLFHVSDKSTYFGLDISQNMIDVARKNHEGFNFFRADALSFSTYSLLLQKRTLTEPRHYDLVVSLFSIPDYCGLDVVGKAYDFLVKGGTFVSTFINKTGGYEKIFCLEENGFDYKPQAFTYEEIQSAFKKAGYGVFYISGFSHNALSNKEDPVDMCDLILRNKDWLLDDCKYYFAMAKKT